MSESWRWQLRDSEGQWVKMGSKVKWLSRGKWLHGTVTGSPRPNYATVKPAGGGPTRNIDVRRMSVEAPSTHATRNPVVSIPPEVYAGERRIVSPSEVKVGDYIFLPSEETVVPLDARMTKVYHPQFTGQVTSIEPRGKGKIITVTGEGKNKRQIAASDRYPPLTKITPPQPKSDAGIGRPTRTAKATAKVPAAAKTPDPEEQRRQWWLQRTGSPGPTGTPEQIEALSPVDKGLPLKEELRADENKRRDLLKIAAEAKPGTHVWRGETLSGSPQDAASIGIHWSASPSPVITKAPDMIGLGQTDVIWHGVIEKDTQSVPRSHPMWSGIHRSMDSEAEVRLRPGTHVRILGVRENGEYHKVDRRLIVENKGDLQYEGIPSFAVLTPLEPHGTIEPEGGMKVTTSPATSSRVANQAAALTRAQAIALKALTEMAPKATSDPVEAGDISQHIYGKRTAASAIQKALSDPALADFVDTKRSPTVYKGKTRILYSPRRAARQAAAAGLLDSGKTDVPVPKTDGTMEVAKGATTVTTSMKRVTPTQEKALVEAHESIVGMVSDTSGVKRSTLVALDRAGLVEIQTASRRRGATATGRVGKDYHRVDTTTTAMLTDEGRRYLREVLGKEPKNSPAPSQPTTVKTSAKKRSTAVVFDMDGTLADVSSIRHHVEGENRDFHRFHTESVNVPSHAHVVELAKQAEAEGHHVAIVTARKAKYRNPTAMWLALNGVPSHSMHMRADNDSRPDYEVKQDIHKRLSSEFNIVHAVDDNPNVIKLWQEHGIPTTVVPGWEDAQPEAKSPEVQAAEKKALAVKTDTRLAEIYEARLSLINEQFRLEDSIHRLSGSKDTKPRFSSGPADWDRTMDEALTDFQGQAYYRERWEGQVAKHQANKERLAALDKEAGELNQVYLDAGTWTRAFLVTNAGGHVHRSMSCSTCYPTTRFHWLPEYSGSDESQIVDDAGERACTVCYPSAPVDVLKRATKIFSDDEKTAAVARQERAAAKVARDAATAAKAISNADGTDLWVMDAYDIDRSKQPPTRYSPRKYGEHLKTEVAARQWYIRHEADLMVTQNVPEYRYGSAYNPEAQEQILLALAAKHSVTVEEIRAELAAKAKARANKELRALGRPKIA